MCRSCLVAILLLPVFIALIPVNARFFCDKSVVNSGSMFYRNNEYAQYVKHRIHSCIDAGAVHEKRLLLDNFAG